MNVEAVDEAMDRYIHERLEKGKKDAGEHFLAFVYLTRDGDEQRRFLHDVARLAAYYVDFLKVAENPLKGPELPWFGVMLVVGIFSVYLIGSDEYRLLGEIVLAGTLVNGWMLVRVTARKWREIRRMIGVYREIGELAAREEETIPPPAA